MSPTASNKRIRVLSTPRWTLDQACDFHNIQRCKKKLLLYVLSLCLIESCRRLYRQPAVCANKDKTHSPSLIFLLMFVWQRWWWSFIEAGRNWSWLLWLAQQPRWSLNYSLHVLPLCDLLNPSGVRRIGLFVIKIYISSSVLCMPVRLCVFKVMYGYSHFKLLYQHLCYSFSAISLLHL